MFANKNFKENNEETKTSFKDSYPMNDFFDDSNELDPSLLNMLNFNDEDNNQRLPQDIN